MDDVTREIFSFLNDNSKNGCIQFSSQEEAAGLFNKELRDIEEIALNHSLIPLRYRKNQPNISPSQQLQLFHSTVSVIGCGGLGGHVIENLARLGVGCIAVMDPDLYEEHNINRQQQATLLNIGHAKVDEINNRVKEINPVINLIPLQDKFSGRLISPADTSQVIVDALDSIKDRKHLATACKQKSIPLVHGAVDGWYGQVAVILPDGDSLSQLYRITKENHHHTLSFTVAAVGAIQASEVCKLLLEHDSPLLNHCLHIDLLNCETHLIPL